MTDWKIVQGSQTEKPAEFDTATSAVVVYQRRNIERITVDSGDGAKTELWQYEERQMTHDEYYNMRQKQNAANVDYLSMMTGVDLPNGG